MYDVIIIGAGPAGYPAAEKLSIGAGISSPKKVLLMQALNIVTN